jgi:hypothetical protein
MATVALLLVSNVFMTFAWYGHLRYRSAPIAAAVLVSWLIALGEYCFQVPANRLGYGQFSVYQLKIIQEAITLVVFMAFAYLYMGETLRWNNAASLVCVMAAVALAFWHA